METFLSWYCKCDRSNHLFTNYRHFIRQVSEQGLTCKTIGFITCSEPVISAHRSIQGGGALWFYYLHFYYRYGRKPVLLASIFLSTIMGTIRSFTTSIEQFIIFELLDSIVSGGIFSTAFVLAMELVDSSQRIGTGALLTLCMALGKIFVGFMAWIVNSWRTFLIAIYLPGFYIILYWWWMLESSRWTHTYTLIQYLRVITYFT